MTNTPLALHAIAISLLLLGVVAWPKWMSLTRNLLSNRMYFLLSSRLKYSEIRAIFSGIFYVAHGTILMIILMLIIPDVDYLRMLHLEKIVVKPLEFVIETILMFFAGITMIFVISNVIFAIIPRLRVTPKSYEDSWMEIYLQVPSRKILLISALFPVIIEELLFRWIVLGVILDAFISINESGMVPSHGSALFVSAFLGVIVFCFQQAIFLKTKEQLMTVLNGAFSIGLINSVALLLGASILSLLFVHYTYLLFFIIQQVTLKNMQKFGSSFD